MIKKLALVGRPNVGKSTLFNRFAGKRVAIVHDTPGVTRDWKEVPARLGDLEFIAIDTAGLEEIAKNDPISTGMRRQTETALSRADAILFIIDGRAPLTAADRDIADILRKQDAPVILAANKCEAAQDLSELYALGLGDPIPISGAHGTGMADLYAVLQPLLDVEDDEAGGEGNDDASSAERIDFDALEEEAAAAARAIADKAGADDEPDEILPDGEEDTRTIHLALVGRPNVGKSTTLNALIGEERALVSPVAGTTRDTIATEWQWRGRAIRLVDTAGLRRKARIDETLEKMAVAETLRVVRLAEIVILVLDANSALEQQDLTIADLVLREGRALVIALNKWDSVTDPRKTLNDIQIKLDSSLQQAKGIAVVPFSALKGRKLDKLMDAVLDTHKIWNKRISTGQLNRWLEVMVRDNPPPLVDGRRVKIRYMTQRKGRPPTFTFFCGTHAKPPESYLRYLANGLRIRFNFPGVPLRLEVRRGKNPYASE